MTAIRAVIAAPLLTSLLSGAVFAQTVHGNTDGAASSIESGANTRAVGQTEPLSRDAGPTSLKPVVRPTAEQVPDDAITTKVCVGCRTEPTTADPLSLKIRPSGAPERRNGPSDERDGQRDARLTTGEPQKQSDLDTVALASAHRERADSVQERTTGLWQSWLVSVCDGCGDRKPAKVMKLEDWPYRGSPATTGSIVHKALPMAARPEAKPIASRPRGTLEADLSPENVGSIRRMPQP